MIARIRPGSARFYPSVERNRWYPVLRRDPHVPGFFIPLASGGYEGERFVWDQDFELQGG